MRDTECCLLKSFARVSALGFAIVSMYRVMRVVRTTPSRPAWTRALRVCTGGRELEVNE